MPPFWSLGWHQCRWGYKTLKDMTAVVEQYAEHDIPLDTIWNDLDSMREKAIFTIDERNYPSDKFQNMLASKELHYRPLVDVGVALSDPTSNSLGKRMKVFFRDLHDAHDYYVGEVWPGAVNFVDWLHPNATAFWMSQLARLY